MSSFEELREVALKFRKQFPTRSGQANYSIIEAFKETGYSATDEELESLFNEINSLNKTDSINALKKKKFNVTVECAAYYDSSISVPGNMSREEAIQYAKEHIDEIPLGKLEYVPDSDVLDEENCEFSRTRGISIY